MPDVLVGLRSEFAGLSDIERRLLAARYLLGLEPELDAAAARRTISPESVGRLRHRTVRIARDLGYAIGTLIECSLDAEARTSATGRCT